MQRQPPFISSVSHHVTGAGERWKMVGHGADYAEIRDPTGFRSHAGHGGGLAAATGRSFVGMVAARDLTAGAAAAGRHPRHHQPGEKAASHREDARSHGAEAADRRGRAFRADDDVVEHLHGRKGDRVDGDIGRATIVESHGSSR